MGAREILEELGSPGPAEAAVLVEAIINVHASVYGEGNEGLLTAHLGNVVVVLNAVETFAVGDLILPDEDLMGSLERGGHDEAAALVIERGEDERRGRGLFDRLKLRGAGSGADDADHGYGPGDGGDFRT